MKKLISLFIVCFSIAFVTACDNALPTTINPILPFDPNCFRISNINGITSETNGIITENTLRFYSVRFLSTDADSAGGFEDQEYFVTIFQDLSEEKITDLPVYFNYNNNQPYLSVVSNSEKGSQYHQFSLNNYNPLIGWIVTFELQDYYIPPQNAVIEKPKQTYNAKITAKIENISDVSFPKLNITGKAEKNGNIIEEGVLSFDNVYPGQSIDFEITIDCGEISPNNYLISLTT